MKRLMMLLVCLALVIPSVGCCWTHGMGYGAGYGNCPGGACGPTPYGGNIPGAYPSGAYYGGTTSTAGIAPLTPYAAAPIYPQTAVLNPLPTY